MKTRITNYNAIAFRICKSSFAFIISVIILTSCNNTTHIFRKGKISSSVCNHRWGMDMSFTQTSDRYLAGQMAYTAEFYGLMHNIPLTVFVADGSIRQQELAYQMGRMDFGVYVKSCIESIEQDPRKSVEKSIAFVKSVRSGLKPSTLSYGCGKDEYRSELADLFLMGRNSNGNDTNGYNYYGKNLGAPSDSVFTHLQLLSRPSTTRYFQLMMDSTKNAKEIVKAQIMKAFQTHGFFTDFSHWQAYINYKHISIDELKMHFENMSNVLDTISVYRGSFNQIAEYYYTRESVDNVKAFRMLDKIIVEVAYSKKDEIDYGLINVPVSIVLKTGRRKKTNDDYSSNRGGNIRKLENGDLVVDINLDYKKNFISDTLEITNSAEYLNFNVPKVKLINNTLSSDQKVKVTVFERSSVNKDKRITPVHRSLVFSEEHTFPVTKRKGYEYYIGFINNTNNSGMIRWDD